MIGRHFRFRSPLLPTLNPTNSPALSGDVTTDSARPVYHIIAGVRACGGRGEPGPDSMRIAGCCGSPKWEVRIVRALFLRGVGGTVESPRKTGCRVPYARPLRPQNTYALTSAYALRHHLVCPHLCVRPTPSPSMPSPLRTPYALT